MSKCITCDRDTVYYKQCANCQIMEEGLPHFIQSHGGVDFVRKLLPKVDNWPDWDYEAVLEKHKATVEKGDHYWWYLGWRHGSLGLNVDDEVIARKSAAVFIELFQRGFVCSFADNLAHGFAMWLELQAGRRSIEMTPELCEAIVDMDDLGYTEGRGPVTKERILAWDNLVKSAERITGRKALDKRTS